MKIGINSFLQYETIEFFELFISKSCTPNVCTRSIVITKRMTDRVLVVGLNVSAYKNEQVCSAILVGVCTVFFTLFVFIIVRMCLIKVEKIDIQFAKNFNLRTYIFRFFNGLDIRLDKNAAGIR